MQSHIRCEYTFTTTMKQVFLLSIILLVDMARSCSDGVNQCITCTDALNCQVCNSCPNTTSICAGCSSGFGLNGAVCSSCQSPCVLCQSTSYTSCLTCIDGLYFDGSACQPCMTNCLRCSTGSTCSLCNTTFYLDGSTLQCIVCPFQCTTCEYDAGSSSPSCTACEPSFALSPNIPKFCPEVCGDFLAIQTPCDDQTGNPYDGCTDNCEVEYGFVCNKINFVSVCSYQNDTIMQIISIVREPFANTFTMKVSIWPPLYVFRSSNLKLAFRLTDPIFTITAATFQYPSSQLVLKVDFSQNFLDKQIILEFIPDPSVDERYFATLNSSANFTTKLFHYSSLSLMSAKTTFYLSYAIAGVGILNVLLGIGMRRLVGLQAIIVCQLGVLTLVLVESYLLSPLSSATMLIYSTGLHLNLFPSPSSARLLQTGQTPSQFNGPPHLKQFNLDKYMLSNNFNIFFALQLVPFLCFLILLLVIKCLTIKAEAFNKSEQFDADQASALNQRLTCAIKAKEISLQLLMYIGMFNLAYFVFCSGLFFKYNSQYTDVISLAILAITILLNLVAFVLLYFDPDPFDYFRYSFRREPLAMNFYFIYAPAIVSTALLLVLLPQVWAPLIPAGGLLLFVVIYRPYRQRRENIRSVINLIVLLSCLSIRVLVHFSYSNYNEVGQNAFLLCFVNILLMLLVVLIALGFLIYQIVYVCYLKKKEDHVEREKVMCELEELNVREKMLALESKDTVFKNLLDPKMNLLQFSNLLIEPKKIEANYGTRMPEKQTNSEKSEKDDGETTSRRIKKEMENEKISRNPIDDQVVKHKEYMNKLEKELENDPDLAPQEKEEKGKLMYAMEVLAVENTWIRLKHVRDYTKEKMNEFNAQETKDFLSQYDQII